MSNHAPHDDPINAAPKWETNWRQPNIWHYIAVAPIWLSAITLFILMGMTFSDVLLRSLLNNPIESATELTRLFMAIIVFSALPLVSWQGGHIVVDLLDPIYTRKLARFRDLTIDLICGVALLWPAKRVWDLAERAREYGSVTEYLNLPENYIGWFIAIFTAITACSFIARAISRILSLIGVIR